MLQETLRARSRSRDGDGLSPAAALVRRHDRDRFQTALFAAPGRREALFALYAFNYEIARVRETVQEPMLGQIRLQWWREAIAAAYDGGPVRPHDVVAALTAAIRSMPLSRAHFDALIDARDRDLAGDPPADLAALEAFAESSSAPLVMLAGEALGLRDPAGLAAARAIGIGYGLAGLLRAIPFHARLGWRHLPLAPFAIDPADYRAGRASTAITAAAASVAAAAAAHLARGRQARASVPRGARPALLPALVASRFLKRLRRARFDPFAPVLAAPDPGQIWRLAAAALAGRF